MRYGAAVVAIALTMTGAKTESAPDIMLYLGMGMMQLAFRSASEAVCGWSPHGDQEFVFHFIEKITDNPQIRREIGDPFMITFSATLGAAARAPATAKENLCQDEAGRNAAADKVRTDFSGNAEFVKSLLPH